MVVELDTVIVRVQPSSVPSDRADPSIERIVIGPRPGALLPLLPLPPLPLSSLFALSGFWPWSLPCGLPLASADGEAPATRASGVSDWDGRWAITMMTADSATPSAITSAISSPSFRRVRVEPGGGLLVGWTGSWITDRPLDGVRV